MRNCLYCTRFLIRNQHSNRPGPLVGWRCRNLFSFELVEATNIFKFNPISCFHNKTSVSEQLRNKIILNRNSAKMKYNGGPCSLIYFIVWCILFILISYDEYSLWILTIIIWKYIYILGAVQWTVFIYDVSQNRGAADSPAPFDQQMSEIC